MVEQHKTPIDFDNVYENHGGGLCMGRYAGFGRDTVESRRCLDVRRLNRRGVLRPGTANVVTWWRRDQRVGSIGIQAEHNGIVLRYRTRANGDSDWRHVEQHIDLDTTPCHFGGERNWFLCPECYRRVACLYAGSGGYACRKCHGLNYESQHEGAFGRALLQAQKIGMNLGGTANSTEPFPPRPRYMRRAKYERLRARAEDLTNRWYGNVVGQLKRRCVR